MDGKKVDRRSYAMKRIDEEEAVKPLKGPARLLHIEGNLPNSLTQEEFEKDILAAALTTREKPSALLKNVETVLKANKIRYMQAASNDCWILMVRDPKIPGYPEAAHKLLSEQFPKAIASEFLRLRLF